MKQLSKGVLSIFLVLIMLITALPASALEQEDYFDIQIIPSVTNASVGDVIEYSVIATGSNIAALEFKLLFPEGLRYVANSAVIPEGLNETLGWVATDWTEESMKWTGFNDLGVKFPAFTVIMTFCATVEAEGTHVVGLRNLRPYDGDYEELVPTVYVGSVTAAEQNPTKVTGLKASKIEETAFTVTWDAIEGATKYWVYVDGAIISSTTASTATVTKRTAGTAYEVKVTARLADGTVLALEDAEALEVRTSSVEITAPTVAATAGETSITLKWDATGCAKTWIYLGTSADNMELLYSCTAGSYTVTGLKPDTTYYIQLSHSISGKVVMSEDILAVKTLAVNNPTKVTGLKAAKIEQTSFTVTWDAIEGATKYWVYVDGTIISSTTASTATVTKRTAGTTYEIKVTARLADGTVLALADAEALTVKTPVQEIVAPTATATAGAGSITLKWNSETCTKTWIYLGTSKDNLKLLNSCTADTYTVTGLLGNSKYYIQLSHSINGKVVMSDVIFEVTTQDRINLAVKTQLSGSDLTLDWEANGNSYKYWVTVVMNGKTQIFSTTDTAFTVTGFDPATCTVSVRGINSSGTYDYDSVVV